MTDDRPLREIVLQSQIDGLCEDEGPAMHEVIEEMPTANREFALGQCDRAIAAVFDWLENVTPEMEVAWTNASLNAQSTWHSMLAAARTAAEDKP